MATEVQIDEEKLKAAIEKAKTIDADKLMKAFVEMLKAYSEMAIRIGTVQRNNQDAFESLTYLGSIAPELVKMLAKKAPPAELGAFIQAFLDLVELAPKLDTLMSLSAEEKVEVGQKLGAIANTLEQMINKTPKQIKDED